MEGTHGDGCEPGEFKQLATRTDIVEREVEGEKMVTRHILEQTRRNGDDLAGVKTDLKGVKNDLKGLSSRVDGVQHHLGRVESKVDGLTRNLPEIVGEAVREAFREERGRKR